MTDCVAATNSSMKLVLCALKNAILNDATFGIFSVRYWCMEFVMPAPAASAAAAAVVIFVYYGSLVYPGSSKWG